MRDIIDRIKSMADGDSMTSDQLVDSCLDVLGPLEVVDTTGSGIKDYASKFGPLSWLGDDDSKDFDSAAIAVIQLIVSSQEYQTA